MLQTTAVFSNVSKGVLAKRERPGQHARTSACFCLPGLRKPEGIVGSRGQPAPEWAHAPAWPIELLLPDPQRATPPSRPPGAAGEDLLAAFGTDDQEAICVRILAEGELQVGGRLWRARQAGGFTLPPCAACVAGLQLGTSKPPGPLCAGWPAAPPACTLPACRVPSL